MEVVLEMKMMAARRSRGGGGGGGVTVTTEKNPWPGKGVAAVVSAATVAADRLKVVVCSSLKNLLFIS